MQKAEQVQTVCACEADTPPLRRLQYDGPVRWLALLATAAGCGRFGFGDKPIPDAGMTDPDACTIAIDAGAPRINFNSHRTITTSGALAPVAFAIDDTMLGKIDEATGDLAAFSQPGTLTVTATDAGGCATTAVLAVGGDLFWYAGGTVNSVPTSEVLRSTDGLDWTVVGNLPGARSIGALVTFRDRLWWIAGSDGAVRNEIFVSDNGTTWTTFSTNAPAAASSFAYTVFDDQLYFVGGNNNAGAVYRTTDMVDWVRVGDLPDDNHGGALAAVGGQLIYAGGHNSNVGLFNWVLTSSTGAAWTQVGTLAVPREYAGVIAVGERMYVIGGQNTTPTAQTAVSSTLDGITWTVEPALPAGRAFGAVVRKGQTLLSIGGTDMGGVWQSAIGGAWSAVGSQFPTPRTGGRAAVFTPP